MAQVGTPVSQVVYYAHSMRIYGTGREKRELETIRKEFPCARIVNPSRLQINEMKAFLRQVRRSDVVVFSTLRGWVGRGVFSEVRQAQKKMKLVYIIRDGLVEAWNGRFRVLKKDWATKYALATNGTVN